MMKIRKATKEDTPQIKIMYRELFALLANLYPQLIQEAEQDEGFLKEMVSKDTADIFVADDGNMLVGFMVIVEQSTPPYNCFIQQRYAYIIDIMVKEHYRGRGIGKSFLQAAKEWTKDKDLHYLELNVLSKNLNAMKLYHAEGFNEQMKTMRFEL